MPCASHRLSATWLVAKPDAALFLVSGHLRREVSGARLGTVKLGIVHILRTPKGGGGVSRNTTLGLRAGSRPGYVVFLLLPFYCILADLTEFAHRNATRLFCTFPSL